MMQIILPAPFNPIRVIRSLQNIPAPTVICRCCGQHIETQWQPGSSRRPGYWLLTCSNDACALYNYTFSVDHYPDLDLSPYLDQAV